MPTFGPDSSHVLEWPRTGGMRAAIPQGGRYSLDLAKVHQVELSINGEGCKTPVVWTFRPRLATPPDLRPTPLDSLSHPGVMYLKPRSTDHDPDLGRSP